MAVRSPSFARMMTRAEASSLRRSCSGMNGIVCASTCAPSPVAALTTWNAGRATVVATLLAALKAPSAACPIACSAWWKNPSLPTSIDGGAVSTSGETPCGRKGERSTARTICSGPSAVVGASSTASTRRFSVRTTRKVPSATTTSCVRSDAIGGPLPSECSRRGGHRYRAQIRLVHVASDRFPSNAARPSDARPLVGAIDVPLKDGNGPVLLGAADLFPIRLIEDPQVPCRRGVVRRDNCGARLRNGRGPRARGRRRRREHAGGWLYAWRGRRRRSYAPLECKRLRHQEARRESGTGLGSPVRMRRASRGPSPS